MSQDDAKFLTSQSNKATPLRKKRSSSWVRMAVVVLTTFYATALLADFFAPYSYDMEDRSYSFSPPTPIRLKKTAEGWRLGVFRQRLEFDAMHRRRFVYDANEFYPLKFLDWDQQRRLWGWVPIPVLVTVDAPARLYLLGADSRGRDMFSRLLYGGRISLSIGLIGVAIAFSLGLFIGAVSGYAGGWVDELLMRLCEAIMIVPGFYLLLALRAAVPDDFNSVQVYCSIVVILSFIGWAGLARIIRGMTLSLKQRDYVIAAKAMGVSHGRIILTHILPHTVSYSLVAAMLSVPGYILGEAGLSLLGLGISDPYASWGNMLAEAMSVVNITFAWWILTPGICIFLTVMSFNILADALRDRWDPRYHSEAV